MYATLAISDNNLSGLAPVGKPMEVPSGNLDQWIDETIAETWEDVDRDTMHPLIPTAADAEYPDYHTMVYVFFTNDEETIDDDWFIDRYPDCRGWLTSNDEVIVERG